MTAERTLPKATLKGIPRTDQKLAVVEAFAPTPRHPSRAVAGLLLAAHRHAEFGLLESGMVRVPSASEPGLHYTVDLFDEGRCTCPFWRFGDAFDGHRAVDKHLVAAEFWLAFVRAAPGISFRVEERYDSRFGLATFDVLESVPEGFEAYEFEGPRDWIGRKVIRHEREWSTALSLEAALMDVVDVMQDRISEAFGEAG